ncbi:hypothetical protein [Actinoplanes sp. NPDC049265]|uniref:hypothetical protein n=1 Tax=Actinoplanes sp. NPDC049265 TaxID=3363902 RepID=UPI0037199916
MAGSIPAICLEGWTPVASGLHLGIDPTAEVPTWVLDTPPLPGLVQVHLGEGALGALRVGDALAREHATTIARMVEVLAPNLAATISRAEVNARTAAHHIPVQLPGRRDLLDPADQRVLPIDDTGRVVDPGLATGARVLPNDDKHLADAPAAVDETGVVLAHPPMPGQVRHAGDATWIGLPAAVVNARHSAVTEARPAGATSRLTHFTELLIHLDTLRPGEQAVVEMIGTASGKPHTYLVVADPDGLSVLRLADGTATAQPLPYAFDTMTVTMPGPLGLSAASLTAMAAQLPPIDLADTAACVTGIRNLARDLYGSVRTGQAVDDLNTLPSTLTRSADPLPDPFAGVADRQWVAFSSLSTVTAALRGAPVGVRGATVFALVGRPGAIGHAVAFRDTADGVHSVDFRAGEVGAVRPAELVADDFADARMLLVDGNGQVAEIAAELESDATVRALLDSGLAGPDGIRYAGPQDRKGKGPARHETSEGKYSKRSRDSESGQPESTSKRSTLSVSAVMREIRTTLTDHGLDMGKLTHMGRSTAEVNYRYAHTYKSSSDDYLMPVGQSLQHLSLVLFHAARDSRDASAGSAERDFEMQSMIINSRLVIASNADSMTQRLYNKVGAERPISDLLSANYHTGYRNQEDVEARRRLNDAVSKLTQSMSGNLRPATSVTNILAARGLVVVADASDADRMNKLLTSRSYENAVILLYYGSREIHAEQKLMIAVHSAGLVYDSLRGDFAIHGRMRPCLACYLGLVHMNRTLGVHHNHNPGNAFDTAFESLLRHLPWVGSDPSADGTDSAGSGRWLLRRLGEMLDGHSTNVSAWSNDTAPYDAVQGPAPQYGLQKKVGRQDRRNYTTPSTSGDEERIPQTFKPTVAGGPGTVRQDLTGDVDVARLTQVSQEWVAVGDRTRQLPGEWTRLVGVIYRRVQSYRAIAEHTAGISEDTVRKHVQQGARLLDQAEERAVEKIVVNHLWDRLRELVPAGRSSEAGSLESGTCLTLMKNWGVTANSVADYLRMPKSSFERKYWKKIILGQRFVPNMVREEVERERAMFAQMRQDLVAPPNSSTAPSSTMSLPYRPVSSVPGPAAQQQFESRLTDYYEVDGIQWHRQNDAYYHWTTDSDGRTVAMRATGLQDARIRRVLDQQHAGPSSAGASTGSNSYSGYSYPPPSQNVPSFGYSSQLSSSEYDPSSNYSHSPRTEYRRGPEPTYAGTDYATGPESTQPTTAPAAGYTRGRDYYVGDDWIVRNPEYNEWDQHYVRDGDPETVFKPIVGSPNKYEMYRHRQWTTITISNVDGRVVRHASAGSSVLEPLIGVPSTTPLSSGDGIVFGAPGSSLVTDLATLRLPKGSFSVLGEGYRNDVGDAVRGGIRESLTHYVTADTISEQIPPGTAAVNLVACEIVSTGTLRELFRRRPELTVVGADTEVFVVQGVEGSNEAAKVFAAETVWVDGRPHLMQTPANQFRTYRPGMSPDMEPEALGHHLPGTGVPTRTEMAQAVEASRAFHQSRTDVARQLGAPPSPVDQIVRSLTSQRLDSPRPGLTRAQPLADVTVFNRDLRALLERQIDHGEHLLSSLQSLSKQGYVRSALGDRLHVAKHRYELSRAIDHLRGALAGIPAPRTGARAGLIGDGPAAEAPDVAIAEAVEHYAHVAEETAKHMRGLVTDAAVKSAVRGEESKTKKVLEKTIGLFEGALGWTAGVFLPTGLSAAPALVGFAGKSAGMAAMKVFEDYQAKAFQKQNSSTRAILLADLKPDAMARSIVASYQKGFDLFVAAAAVGGAYVPGWPMIASGLTKIFKGFFDERIKLLEKQITEIKASQHERPIQEKDIFQRLGDRLWNDLRAELKAKLTDLGAAQQIVNAAKGEPELIGLIGIGTDFAVRLGLGAVLTLFPPKPTTKIDGNDLRKVILDVISNRNPADTLAPATTTLPAPDEDIPASVPQTDSHGRQILGYNASMSRPDAPFVKVNVHGTNLWGTLSGAIFKPHEPDLGAFVSMEIWKDRVIGPDHYVETARDPETGTVAEVQRVDGSWHQPWPDKYHFLFVHQTDGTWEWAHAFSPTGRMETDEFNLKAEFDRNPAWLKHFSFEAPAAIGVSFQPRKSEPILDSWTLHQFVDNVAWKAADLSRVHGPHVPLKIHVEGGGNGQNALQEGIGKLGGLPEQAATVGLARADAVRTRLVDLLDTALDRLRYRHPKQAGRLPTAQDIVAAASSRGSQLTASKLPTGLLRQSAALDDEALHRQTRVWIEEQNLAAPPSPASAQSSLGSSFHESDLDVKPQWLATAQDTMPHPQNAPANLIGDTGSLTAKGAPPRALVKLAEEKPDQIFYWLSTQSRQAPTPKQITELNEVLEQFGQGKSQVSVFTKGVVSVELLDAIAPYGGALANSAPAGLENAWHVQPADRTVPRSQRPGQPTDKIDGALADSMAKLYRDPGITRTDEQFGAFLWGGLSVREQHERLKSSPATYLTQANKLLADEMAERVKTSQRAGIAGPLLAFGADTDVVPRYHESTMLDRPKTVISGVFELADSGVTGATPITEKFQTLVEAVGRGAGDVGQRNQFDFTTALLKAIDLARAGQFAEVAAWVAENKPRLDAEMKGAWVDALGGVIRDLRSVSKGTEAQQLEPVLAAVYAC